jgi:hypothetical protein
MRTLVSFCSLAVVASVFACTPDALGGADAPSGGDNADESGKESRRVGTMSAELCQASPAPAVFGNALCLCGDFRDVGNLVVKGGTGSLGSVGVNGSTKVINNSQVDGAWGSAKGFEALGNVNINKSMYTAGNLRVTGNLQVAENLEIGGALSGIGRVSVKGELRAQGGGSVLGVQDVGGKGTYKAPAGPPCSCEGSPGYLDVAKEVDKAKAQNDNKSAGLGSEIQIGATELSLKSGKYLVGSIKTVGFAKVKVSGAVSLYVDGSMEQIGAEIFDLDAGATLDLYVRGNVSQVGHMSFGSAKHPAAFRLFMGGGDAVALNVGNQVFHGAVYAPKARIKYVGNTVLEGGLFAYEVDGIGNLEVRGARPAPPAGCPGSDDSGGTGGGSGNGNGGGAGNGTGTGSGNGGSTPAPRSDGVGTVELK